MPGYSRRSFLAHSSLIPLGALLESCSPSPSPTPGPGPNPTPTPPPAATFTRPDATSAVGQAMLQTYASVADEMKNAIAEDSPTSWLFQWYTHGVRNDRSKASELTRVYPTPGPGRNLANDMWETCQAHRPGQIEDDFLPWHRMYVYYFERIVRQLSSNPDFVLPYWNYSVAGANHGVVPPEFRDSSSALFQGNRSPGVNNGQPIDQNAPGALALTALGEASYSANAPNQGFCAGLDFGLHGAVHVLTGDSLNMGSVPWAANDAVFWMHHCNIDRLWTSWNNNGGQNPLTDSRWMNEQFVFADENGNRVVGTTQDFVDIAQLDYTYDRLEPAPAGFQPLSGQPTPLISMLEAASVPATLRATGVQLGATPSRAVLTSEVDQPAAFNENVANVTGGGGRLHLVLQGLMAASQPGVLYGVHLNLPENATAADMENSRVGYIQFFESVAHAADDGAVASEGKFFGFDITQVAERLGDAGTLGTEPAVTIRPQGVPDQAAQAMVGEILLIEE